MLDFITYAEKLEWLTHLRAQSSPSRNSSEIKRTLIQKSVNSPRYRDRVMKISNHILGNRPNHRVV